MIATSMLVWILALPAYTNRPLSQIGPFSDLESCERVQKEFSKMHPLWPGLWGVCVQVNMPVMK